jgi:hypothetical protein
MKQRKSKKNLRSKNGLIVAGACLGIMVGGGVAAHAQTTTNSPDTDKITELEKENQDLAQRLGALEDLAKKEGIMPSDAAAPKFVSAISNMTISGFVQASYFYNIQRPASGYSAGYLWNTKDNSFSLNKVKITFASAPAARSDTDWTAGYRVSLIAGEDAPILNSSAGTTGFDYLREGYVELNVPIGKGLNIKAGELISLLNWESGDGGAANPNFSQGYQWYYTGNGPSAGVQLDYAFTDWLDVKFRVDNGLYAGPIAHSDGKGVMGSLNFTPTKNFWFNLIGFGGEGVGTLDVDGASVLAGYQVTSQLGTGFEFDYFHFDPDGGATANLWSLGGWVWYDFTSKVGLALRTDFIDNPDALADFGSPAPFGGFGAPGIASTSGSGNLESITLTLNFKPSSNIKIQPEIRYNHTSYSNGFEGKNNQFIIGCGASYLF